MVKKLLSAAVCVLSLTALFACGSDEAEPAPGKEVSKVDQEKLDAGFRAVEAACFSCHSPRGSAADRIAPPMVAIKKHYVDNNTTYAEFYRDLQQFVSAPSAENARMPGAIQRFGLMPNLGINEAMLEQIAYYIFHSPMENPRWFEEHYARERHRSRSAHGAQLLTDADYLMHGQQIAMRTKSELGKNLKQALKTGGPTSAIQFCSEQAVPIADDMSVQLKAAIKRVSDRPRNPGNAAVNRELQYIASASAALAAGNTPEPSVQELDGRMVGYYPIVTNGMCLQCHGSPGVNIAEDTMSALQATYPNDKATGYEEGQIRGIWVITMEKKSM